MERKHTLRTLLSLEANLIHLDIKRTALSNRQLFYRDESNNVELFRGAQITGLQVGKLHVKMGIPGILTAG